MTTIKPPRSRVAAAWARGVAGYYFDCAPGMLAGAVLGRIRLVQSNGAAHPTGRFGEYKDPDLLEATDGEALANDRRDWWPEELAPLIGTRPACRSLGASVATIYCRRRPSPQAA